MSVSHEVGTCLNLCLECEESLVLQRGVTGTFALKNRHVVCLKVGGLEIFLRRIPVF
jgi:hypothetical protein